MTMHRMLPPTTVAYQTRTVNGRTYSGTPGQVLDVPSFDADVLAANGWSFVAQSGPTSARPTPSLSPIGPEGSQIGPSAKYFDTTINQLIVSDGATWRSAVDGSAL